MNDIELIREYIRREYRYEGVDDPVSQTMIRQSSKDGELNAEEREGDYWITDGMYGELVRIEDGKVRQVYFEGA